MNNESIVRYIKGRVDKDSTLVFEKDNVSNSGENLVTELVVELPTEVLLTCRLYFEFLLPTQERFISEPLSAHTETVEDVDQLTRQPITRDAIILRYKLPRYVAIVSGNLITNIKATNDSITVYKSKIAVLKVDDSTNSEFDDRYYKGDLLDYIVNNKIDTFDYKEGWLIGYLKIPDTGELVEVTRCPVNPFFESKDAAEDWVLNSGEATKGQLIAVVVQPEGDPYGPQLTTAYLVNPDMTLSKVMTEGTVLYEDLLNLPRLNTTIVDGSLEPQESEIIKGTIKLAKVAKTGRISDLINDKHFAIIHTHRIRSAGSPVVDHEISASQDGEYLLNLEKVIFNVGLNEGDQLLIEVGSDDTNWRQMLSQDDIDVTLSATSYVVNQSYGYTLGEHFRVSVVSDSNNISIDIVTNHG